MLAMSRLDPEGNEDPNPPMPHIFNDVEHDGVAVELDPVSTPALVLFVDSSARVAADNAARKMTRSLMLAIAYMEKPEISPLAAVRNGSYTLDAALNSLVAFNSLQRSADNRKLNDVQILSIDEIQISRIASDVGKAKMYGFLVATVSVIVN